VATLDEYQDRYENYRFERTPDGILTMTMHTEGKDLVWGMKPDDDLGKAFVDIGSGRGRALILAIEHGFHEAIGVELDAEHHRIATANVRHYRGIQLVHGDARDFAFPPGPLVVFIYNPFPRHVMEEFVPRLAPVDGWLIYEAPLDRDLVDGRAPFELVAERTERVGASPRSPRFAIYRAVAHRGDDVDQL